MPTLNDYLGSLVSSITNARVMSDIQTVKVAEEYAKHDLLKHFSVPRMRIDDIEMTVPVALGEIDASTGYRLADTARFNALVYRELVHNMGLTKLPAEVSKTVRAEIARQTKVLEQDISTKNNLLFLPVYSEALSAFFIPLLDRSEKPVPKEDQKTRVPELAAKLEQVLSKEIQPADQKTINGNLNVIVEAHKLREQKAENIIYIKLKISEDGMEWIRNEDSNGNIESKLLPE